MASSGERPENLPSGRLAALGLRLPEVAAPVASYVPAVAEGGLVRTSGQLPFVMGKLGVRGKVGEGPDLVRPAVAQEQARLAVLNALAAVAQTAGSVDDIRRIVKVVGYVASDPSFTGQPGVVDGASELLGAVFGAAGQHARSAVGVAVLPLDAPVEIELIVALADD